MECERRRDATINDCLVPSFVHLAGLHWPTSSKTAAAAAAERQKRSYLMNEASCDGFGLWSPCSEHAIDVAAAKHSSRILPRTFEDSAEKTHVRPVRLLVRPTSPSSLYCVRHIFIVTSCSCSVFSNVGCCCVSFVTEARLLGHLLSCALFFLFYYF